MAVRPGALTTAGGGVGGRSRGFDFRKVLAWFSFSLGVVGGAAIAITPIGAMLARVTGILPTWLLGIVFLVLVFLLVRDIGMDGEPNRTALWVVLLAPTLARSVSGNMADLVTEWSGQALAEVSGPLGAWLGLGAPLAFAVGCSAGALVLAQRALKG